MRGLGAFLANPRRWLQRRKDHKKIIAAARDMKGLEYRWPPRGGMADGRSTPLIPPDEKPRS